ncbi:hypothetical protein PInf_014703 [Phytophthora infestans]|nr:hypothetical protein PInf_014703 [Phytophthora infestans]
MARPTGEAKIDLLLVNPQRSTMDPQDRCACCGKLQYGNALRIISGWGMGDTNGPNTTKVWEGKAHNQIQERSTARIAWRMLAAMSPDWYHKTKKRRSLSRKLTTRNVEYIKREKQHKSKLTCKANIDLRPLNPQRSTWDSRARCVGCGKLPYGYALRTISGRGSVRHCIVCKNGPKAVKFWEEKPPPPGSAEVRRQESLANVKKEMGPDWYPKKEKRRSRPRKLTARNAKYIEEKKQQKSK